MARLNLKNRNSTTIGFFQIWPLIQRSICWNSWKYLILFQFRQFFLRSVQIASCEFFQSMKESTSINQKKAKHSHAKCFGIYLLTIFVGEFPQSWFSNEFNFSFVELILIFLFIENTDRISTSPKNVAFNCAKRCITYVGWYLIPSQSNVFEKNFLIG